MIYHLNPAAAQWKSMSRKRSKVIDQLAHRSLQVIPRYDGAVILQLNKPVKLGGDYVQSTVLFASNSKMKCLTFTLPAARAEFGGTCPAEALSDRSSRPGFVCNGCYAGKGSYNVYSAVPISQAIKQMYVMSSLSAGNLANELIDAIKLGFDSGYAAKWGRAAEHVFRIHDSGDFYSVDYLKAWMKTCAHFQAPNRKILFWAPTRMWVFPKFRSVMGQAPPNLILRPSALYVDDPPPIFPEFAFGSTVNNPGPVPGTTDSVGGVSCWICPAYRHDKKDASCESENCRRCWGKREHISYTEH